MGSAAKHRCPDVQTHQDGSMGMATDVPAMSQIGVQMVVLNKGVNGHWEANSISQRATVVSAAKHRTHVQTHQDGSMGMATDVPAMSQIGVQMVVLNKAVNGHWEANSISQKATV